MTRYLRTVRTVVAGLLAWAALSSPSLCDDSVDGKFDALCARYIDEFPSLSPVSATLLGDHRFDSRLDQVSAEARLEKARFVDRYLEELGQIDREKLSRENQVDHAILSHHLHADLWSLETLQEWAWNPLAYTALCGSAIYGLMAREFAPLPTRLASVTERLEEFPRLYGQIRATLQPPRVPRVHAETAVAQNRGVLSILANRVEPHLAALRADRRDRLERAIAIARDAVDEHQKWLESELLPTAHGNFRLGAKLYDQKLAIALHTPMTRAQVRKRADEQLRLLHERMYGISRGIYRTHYPFVEFPVDPSSAYKKAIIRACLELAYAERPDRDGIVETARRSLETTTRFVRENDLVTMPPDPVEVIVMPEFERGVSLAYCDSPGALDVGQKTFYAVAPPPRDWTAQQVDSQLREYNIRSMHTLTIHEAMPGHYLQLAHANRCENTLRAVLSSGVFIEGWAVYTEWMMCEEGFLDKDPLMELIVLKWYLRDTTNAILDQALHVDGITEEEAMKLLIEDAFQEEREAAGKWTRARLTAAQLSTYFVGYLELVDLRRAVETALGDAFDLKAYHDRALSFGSLSPQFVRALMLDLEIPVNAKQK